ncbi:unnamed protein product [Phaedon cochleariae]|uniref:Mutator-like transposase domain-containing protein n=1 Tax=Phaedon cochleariae TaxID=80249 RepID=A0A9N9X3N9_PHACE|nr:unnamed protein product [Phaedon cochleariae]
MNIPTISSKTFSRIQESLADSWEETAMEEMAKAAKEEKRLAIQCGDVTTDGTDLITVVYDGVWAQRFLRLQFFQECPIKCAYGLVSVPYDLFYAGMLLKKAQYPVLRIMEDERVAFLEETGAKLDKQRKIIRNLEEEKHKIEEDNTTTTCMNQKRSDQKIRKNIIRLLDEFEKYDILARMKSDQLKELEFQIRKWSIDSSDDADVLTVKTAIEQSSHNSVAVVGEDVDLAVLLIAHTSPVRDILLLKPR